MPKKIINSIQAENIRQAFAAKYELDRNRAGELSERQHYFGAMHSEELGQMLGRIDRAQDMLSYTDVHGTFDLEFYPLAGDPVQIERLVKYSVVAFVTVTYRIQCPLTTKKTRDQHHYFLTKKMWDEIQELVQV